MTQVKAAMMMTTPTQIQMHLCQLLVAKRVIITAAMGIATFVVIEGIGHPDVLIDTKLFTYLCQFCDFSKLRLKNIILDSLKCLINPSSFIV